MQSMTYKCFICFAFNVKALDVVLSIYRNAFISLIWIDFVNRLFLVLGTNG